MGLLSKVFDTVAANSVSTPTIVDSDDGTSYDVGDELTRIWKPVASDSDADTGTPLSLGVSGIGDFDAYRLTVDFQGDVASGFLYAQLNNDTGTNYDYNAMDDTGITSTSGDDRFNLAQRGTGHSVWRGTLHASLGHESATRVSIIGNGWGRTVADEALINGEYRAGNTVDAIDVAHSSGSNATGEMVLEAQNL